MADWIRTNDFGAPLEREMRRLNLPPENLAVAQIPLFVEPMLRHFADLLEEPLDMGEPLAVMQAIDRGIVRLMAALGPVERRPSAARVALGLTLTAGEAARQLGGPHIWRWASAFVYDPAGQIVFDAPGRPRRTGPLLGEGRDLPMLEKTTPDGGLALLPVPDFVRNRYMGNDPHPTSERVVEMLAKYEGW